MASSTPPTASAATGCAWPADHRSCVAGATRSGPPRGAGLRSACARAGRWRRPRLGLAIIVATATRSAQLDAPSPETLPLTEQPNASAPDRPPTSAGPGSAARPGPSRPDASDEPGRRPAPGLREQLGRTKEALLGLIHGHVDLARAELSDIVDEIKRTAALAGIALALLLFAGMLASVGSTLFLGEWLFGSLGWGVLLGSQMAVALAAILVMQAVAPGGSIGRSLLGGIVIGLLIGLLFGSHLPNVAWDRLGTSIAPELAPATRPLVVGLAVMAGVGAVLGLLGGGSAGGVGGAVGGLIGGAILGAALGAFSAITFRIRVAAAVGISVALLFWPVFAAIGLARRGVSTEKLKARFWPSATISTTKETIEWAREQMPLGRKS